MVEAQLIADRQGTVLVVVARHRTVLRPLEVTDLARVLVVYRGW
jgi:hypothetical protein